jgi:hypothetical protein
MSISKYLQITDEFIDSSTEDEVTLARLLLMDPNFIFEVRKARSVLNIKPRRNKRHTWISLNDKQIKRLKYYSKKICKRYGIPWWLWTIEDFITTNQFGRGRDNPLMGNSKNPMEVSLRPPAPSNKFIKRYGFELTFTKRVTKPQIHELIDRNWDEINSIMLQGTKEEFNTKIRNLDFYKDILDLRDKKKKTFEEIADLLFEKYLDPNDESKTEKINADSVKTAYHRIKSILRSLGNS